MQTVATAAMETAAAMAAVEEEVETAAAAMAASHMAAERTVASPQQRLHRLWPRGPAGMAAESTRTLLPVPLTKTKTTSRTSQIST